MSDSESSSSDDEQLAKLKEAVVTVNDLNNQQEQEKSLNNSKNKFEGNFVDVTPEFQEFIAKKLSQLIDDSIEIVELKERKKKSLIDISKEETIYLTNNVPFNEEYEEPKKKKIKFKKEKTIDKSMLEEAAISFDVILQTSCISEHKKLYDSGIK